MTSDNKAILALHSNPKLKPHPKLSKCINYMVQKVEDKS